MVPDSLNLTTNHLEQKHLFGFRACPFKQTSVSMIMLPSSVQEENKQSMFIT